jgi:uncharacterized protein (TIGR02145 family)
MRNCIFIFLFILFALAVDAQTVRNVKATQEGQKIAISYELNCAQPTEINLFLSEDNGQTWNAVKTGVSGDVGTRITQGNKVIFWDVLQSKEKLVGNAFVFKVKMGEEFKTVKIGNQVWMVENLNVDHFRNGDLIQEVRDIEKWGQSNSGTYCYYDNDIANGEVYGKLYNWYAVYDARGLCPSGWHVPSDAEWTIIENYLGGVEVAGGELKSTTGWKSPNLRATNSTGFRAFPGGYCDNGGTFYDIGLNGNWWSSTEYDSNYAWNRVLYFDGSDVNRSIDTKDYGFSVRCVKD